jgi:hypothetical protein
MAQSSLVLLLDRAELQKRQADATGVLLVIGWRDYLGHDFDEKPKTEGGNYFCGCSYVAGYESCEHHGDPVERWPKPVKEDE